MEKQDESQDVKNVRKSKRELAEIFCKMLRDVEPEDVMGDLGGQGGDNIKVHFESGNRKFYISVDF